MRIQHAFLGCAVLVLAGCASVTVAPVASNIQIHNVCIVDNPQVVVPDFIPVLRDGFARHKISTTVVNESQARSCAVTLTYTALRSWDTQPYLSYAELRLWRGDKQIGFAEYHLNDKGRANVFKYRGTWLKMHPVIERLLAGQSGG